MMDKSTIWFLVLILGLLILAGAIVLSPRSPKPPVTVPMDDGLHFYVDNTTGCQYAGNRYGLTVRVNKDGKPVCQ